MRTEEWDEVSNGQWGVFVKFVEGELPHLPWCDNALQSETGPISRQLASLNRAGFFDGE